MFEICAGVFVLIIILMYHSALKSTKEEAMFYKNKCVRLMGHRSLGGKRVQVFNELEREFISTRKGR
jgi:hypothetical protein